MEAKKIIELDGIGSVHLVRSPRAKRLNISIRPFVGIRAAVPSRMSWDEARRRVIANRDWIRKQQMKMAAIRNKHAYLIDIAGDIKRKYARERLTNRLAELAGRHGFSYKRVFVRNQSTLWGSCSSKNNISLNIKLVLLPVDLMDYVLLHELVHTRFKNHSSAFWEELDGLVGGARTKHKKLKEYGLAFL